MLTDGISPEHPALAEACETLGWDIGGEKAKRLVAGLGYAADWRELVAADFGAATSRKRFFLIARKDGRALAWPNPTHAPAGSSEVSAGRKKAWRSAAEIIDWSLPCPSIFSTKEQIKEEYGVNAVRPLADNTLRRIARGMDKFVLKSPEPFIVQTNHKYDCLLYTSMKSTPFSEYTPTR